MKRAKIAFPILVLALASSAAWPQNATVEMEIAPSQFEQTRILIDPVHVEKIHLPQRKLPDEQKSVEIMSKVFDHVLRESLGQDYRTEGFFSDGCTGKWLPHVGAAFQIQVGFSLYESDMIEIDTPEQDQDLWETIEKEASGEPPANENRFTLRQPRIVVKSKTNNNQKISALKDAVLGAVAKYGNRLKGLSGSSMIVVIVEGQNNLQDEVVIRTLDLTERLGELSGGPFEELSEDSVGNLYNEEANETVELDVLVEGLNKITETQKKRAVRDVGVGREPNTHNLHFEYAHRGEGLKQGKSTMVIEIPFSLIPPNGGEVKDIEDAVNITVY